MEQIIIQSDFAKDVLDGLSSTSKYLSSKYFYDDQGSKIFQDIMRMSDYYLTDCELEIFKSHREEILKDFSEKSSCFELVELGAGDGLKTKILLSYFLNKGIDFKYSPIDISEDAVVNLIADLNNELPAVKTNGLVGDYFDLIGDIKVNGYSKKIILFLGSNIGNFDKQTSLDFLRHLKAVLNKQDQLLIGFDLKKDPQLILSAYNDSHGHTAAFNLNLLERINNELGADFVIEDFEHQEIYDPKSGTARSFLKSLKTQNVFVGELYKDFHFEKGEYIFMEMSQKYDLAMINELAENSGFEVVRNYFDSRQYFVNTLLKIKS